MSKSPDSERLQKYLAGLGAGSRRKIEDLIREGKVTVNGKVAELGDKAIPGSRISIDGRLIKTRSVSDSGIGSKQRVILYNKPEGEICTRSDPEGRPTVFANLPRLKGERWVAVGRLDINTRGLLLFTNDGTLANKLMHPSLEIEREYLCRVYGEVNRESIERLTSGIDIDGKNLKFHNIRRQSSESRNSWFSVTVMEGRYREVRRLWESVGCQMSRLVRIRYGKIMLPRGVKLGGWIELDQGMIEKLARNRITDNPVAPKPVRSRNRNSRRQ